MLLNKLFLSFCFFTFIILSHSYAVDADVSIATYYQDDKPFIETSLHIVGATLKEKKVNSGQIETRVNVLITIFQGETIIDFRKYALISPQAARVSDFIDLRRFALASGNYLLTVKLTDQLNSSNIFEYEEELNIVERKDELFVSKVSHIYNVTPTDNASHPFYKYGNVLEPAAFSFFHQAMDKLFVYAELYNTSSLKVAEYAVKVSITNVESKKKVLERFKKYDSSSEKEIVLIQFPIETIESGNYIVSFDIINSSQESLYHSDTYFQRSNPKRDQELLLLENFDLEGSFVNKLSAEELDYNLKALFPRLRQFDVSTLNMLLDSKNLKGQRFFLYNYWVNYDPVRTEETFLQYEKIAEAIDRKFYNTVGHGFETDRGYIFLKYGKPNNVITVNNEPSAPPYEIWFFDQLEETGEVNVKFLFYNPTLGGNNFELLHSTTRNERQNKKWEVQLYSKAPNEVIGNSVDGTTVGDNFNRRAREYFNDNN